MDSDLLQKLGTVLTAALEQRPDRAAMMSLASCRYVTIALASVMTGLSEKAIRRKIEDGVWRERIEWRRAPDVHLMVGIQGVERRVEADGTGQRQVGPRNFLLSSTLGIDSAAFEVHGTSRNRRAKDSDLLRSTA